MFVLISKLKVFIWASTLLLFSSTLCADNLKGEALEKLPNILSLYSDYSTSFSGQFDNLNKHSKPDGISNDLISGNVQLGYKKGDWKKPVKWKKSYAKKAKYGDGVTIGILDGPINCEHKNLKTNSKRTCKSLYYSSANPTFSKVSTFTHGSNAAGVAAGTGGYGLAKNANILGVAVFDDSGWYLNKAQYLDSVDYLVNTKKAKVINMSYGEPYTPGYSYFPGTSNDIEAARLAKGKALVVKSAGNGYKGKGKYYDTTYITDTRKNVLKKYINNVIFVGALNKKGTKIAKWSDRPGNGCIQGLTEFTCTKKNKYKYYFIVAPGYVKTTAGTGNGSKKTNGTSFSAPIVAGAAALIQSRWPHLKPHKVRDILLKTATDMGKKGVDKVYGRGALNLKKALKPVNGKVGGVKVKSANPKVFNRVASLSNFSHDLKVIDEFDRDFDAVNYVTDSQAVINAVDILDDGAFSIYISQKAMSQDEISTKLNGFTAGEFSYFSDTGSINDYTSFDKTDGPLSTIPPGLLSLNIGNQAAIFHKDGFTIFAMSPNSASELFDTTTIGLKKLWVKNDNLTFTSTAAMMTEKGFHGLSSQKGFGFDGKNESIFLDVGLSYLSKLGSFDIGLNHHRADARYLSDNISWSGLGVSQLQAGFSTKVADTIIGVKATSALNVVGTVKSSINQLTSSDDFYHLKEKIVLNVNKTINEQSSINFNLSMGQDSAVDLSYQISF